MHTYEVEITRVIDGDTVVGNVKTHIMDVHLVLTDIYFRLEGINTPELRGETKPAGEAAKEYLSSIILGQTVVVASDEKDKYGRQLGTIFFQGKNINQLLLDEGYAVPYA